MPRQTKAEPMEQTEMIETEKRKRSSRIYKAESQEVTDEAISKSVINALQEIRRSEGIKKIRLDDTETVKMIAESYLESCAVASTFPTMSGLALCLGHTRVSLYKYMEKKPDTETGKFLTQLHDTFASILAENSLRNNANNITAIFVLKSMFGYKETQTLELLQASSQDEGPSVDEIVQRADLLSD